MVFALPGERGLTELAGDFKIHFHDRQGEFYCWLNTTMMENRKTLNTSELDGFDKRKLPSPGFLVEVVLMDYDAAQSMRTKSENSNEGKNGKSEPSSTQVPGTGTPILPTSQEAQEKDDVFSDSESESGESHRKRSQAVTISVGSTVIGASAAATAQNEIESVACRIENVSVMDQGTTPISAVVPGDVEKTDDATGFEDSSKMESAGISDFKAIAADASVFTFGDDEDYESE